MSEAQLLSACAQLLTALKVLFWRNNSGAIKTNTGGFVRLAPAGSPDMYCLANGTLIGLELKAGKNKLTEAQEAYQELLEDNGALYFIIRDPDDLKRLVRNSFENRIGANMGFPAHIL